MSRRKSTAGDRVRFITLADWEVVALQAGHKTQLRRVVKNPGKYVGGLSNCAFCCPIGQPGDLLRVREAWQGPMISGDVAPVADLADLNRIENCVYRADGGDAPEYTDSDDNLRRGWKSAAFMPAWASRLTICVDHVKVEPLVAIGHNDAIAEGIRPWYSAPSPRASYALGKDDRTKAFGSAGSWRHRSTAPEAFLHLWEHQHKVDPHKSDVWAWVITFHKQRGQKGKRA